jgi:hypothetical protein
MLERGAVCADGKFEQQRGKILDFHQKAKATRVRSVDKLVKYYLED